jgi:indoleamine 2,3-dioxygenase
VPWEAVSQGLEIPPVATLSAVSLWNYTTLFPLKRGEIITLDNLATLHTYTGTPSESWFYLISAAIEARSTYILPLLLSSLHAVRDQNIPELTENLRALAGEIVEMGVLLQKMNSECDPDVFYHQIRPFLAGWNNMSNAGLPHGVIYEGTKPFQLNPSQPIDPKTGYRTYAGGSNAQSALIQALDIVMGIDHRPTGDKKDSGGEGIPPPKKHEFIREMRGYMPGSHRRFLEALTRVSNLREFVSEFPRTDEGEALREAYDACLAGLRRFRDIHIQIVSRYILIPSSKASSVKRPNPGGETGTGGTQLMPFLKQVREETMESVAAEYTRGLIAQGLFPRESAKRNRDFLENMNGNQTVGLAGVWEKGFDGGGICHW